MSKLIAEVTRTDTLLEDLIITAKTGRVDTLEWLLQPTNTRSKVSLPLSSDNLNLLLHVACKYGQYEVAKMMIGLGADVNSEVKCKYPLYIVCDAVEENVEIVVLLLESGAKVDVFGSEIDEDDTSDKDYGRTSALMASLERQHTKIAKLLLQRGAMVLDYALNIAAKITSEEGVEIMRILMDKGAEDVVLQVTHTSALYNAVSCINVEGVKLLLENGAKVRFYFVVSVIIC